MKKPQPAASDIREFLLLGVCLVNRAMLSKVCPEHVENIQISGALRQMHRIDSGESSEAPQLTSILEAAGIEKLPSESSADSIVRTVAQKGTTLQLVRLGRQVANAGDAMTTEQRDHFMTQMREMLKDGEGQIQN